MTDQGKTVAVSRNEEKERWEAEVEGGLAVLTYGENDGKLYLLHTEVPKEAEGQGIGSRLVKAALEHARSAGIRVVALCPFAKSYLQRHSEYADLLSNQE